MDWIDDVQQVIDEALIAANDPKVDPITFHMKLVRYIERIERIMQKGGRERTLTRP